jgi:hypothetical protein
MGFELRVKRQSTAGDLIWDRYSSGFEPTFGLLQRMFLRRAKAMKSAEEGRKLLVSFSLTVVTITVTYSLRVHEGRF